MAVGRLWSQSEPACPRSACFSRERVRTSTSRIIPDHFFAILRILLLSLSGDRIRCGPTCPEGSIRSHLPVTLPDPSCHSRRPLPVIPAVFSGNPVKIIFIQDSIGGSYLLGKASMTSEYRTGLEPAPQGMKRKDGFPINNVGNDRRGS